MPDMCLFICSNIFWPGLQARGSIFSQFFVVTTAGKVSKYGDFSVRIFPYSGWIWENTDQKKLCIWTLFKQWSHKFTASRLKEVINILENVSFRQKRTFENQKKFESLSTGIEWIWNRNIWKESERLFDPHF